MAIPAHGPRRLLLHATAAAGEPGSDRELLARFMAGDPAAFAAIVDRHGPMLRGCCRRWVDDPHLADDVLQATFVVLVRKAKSIRRRDSLAAWLYGVARRLARRARLAEEARSRRESDAATRGTAQRSPELDGLLRALDEELARLPDAERAALVLCYLEGRTQDEAASQLGLPLITVRRRLERGRERLRTRLTRRGLTLGAALLAGTVAIDTPALSEELRRTILTAVLQKAGTISPSVMALADGLRLTASPRIVEWCIVAVLACGVIVGVGRLLVPSRGLPADAPFTDKPDAPPRFKPDGVERRDRLNDPLPAGAIARLGTLSFRHGDVVDRITFAPDGKSLLTANHGLFRRWQLDSGHEIETLDLSDPGRGVRADCLTDDGKTMVIVYGKMERREAAVVVVRDVAKQAVVREFTVPHTSASYVLSADGRFLAFRQNNDESEVWDVTKGQLHFRAAHAYATSRFSRDGRRLVQCGRDQSISVWDTATGQRLREFGGGLYQLMIMNLSRDGKWLVTRGYSNRETTPNDKNIGESRIVVEKSLKLWDVEKGELAGTLDCESSRVQTISFAPDSKTLHVVVTSTERWDHAVQHWDVATRKLMATWPDALPDCGAVALSPDGQMLATATSIGSVQLWDVATRRERRVDEGHQGAVNVLGFSADGTSVCTRSYHDRVIDWDLATGKPVRSRDDSNRGPYWSELAISADGTRRAGIQRNSDSKEPSHLEVRDLGVEKRRDLGRYQLRRRRASSLSADGSRLVAVTIDPAKTVVRVWEVDSGKLVVDREFKTAPDSYFRPHLLGDGRIVLISYHGPIVGLDVASGRELFRWRSTPPGSDSQSVLLHPSRDGRLIARLTAPRYTGDPGFRVEMRELATGRFVGRLNGEALSAPLAFSADGKRFAAAIPGTSPAFAVWDVATGEKLYEFTGHRGRFVSLAFSPDGKRLVSGSVDCTALVWDVER